MKRLRLLLLLGTFTLTAGRARATAYYWDINGSTSGAGGAIPSGIWENNNWNATADGTGATAAWVENNDAHFSAGGSVTSISETVTTNFTGGANATLTLAMPAITNHIVTLAWNATEGGTYRVEASGNLSTWTTNATGLAAVLNHGTNAVTELGTNQFFRVVRTGLATYDPN